MLVDGTQSSQENILYEVLLSLRKQLFFYLERLIIFIFNIFSFKENSLKNIKMLIHSRVTAIKQF